MERSKYIEADYKDDLKSLVDFYKEKGYRDARIITDSLIIDFDKIDIKISLIEGKIFFGDIKFIGNSVYSDQQLSRVLGLKEGDTYNGVLLKRICRSNKT